MRKLAMLGLSLILSVGAFAQAQLEPAKALKQSVSTTKTGQTGPLKVKVKDNHPMRSGRSTIPGMVMQKSGKSTALITSRSKSRAKSPVTTPNIYAGILDPGTMKGGGMINPATGAFTQIYNSAGVYAIGMNSDMNEIYSAEFDQEGFNIVGSYYRAYDATTGAVKREKELSFDEFYMLPQRGAYCPDDNAIYGYANLGWVKLDCSTL